MYQDYVEDIKIDVKTQELVGYPPFHCAWLLMCFISFRENT